MDYPGDVVVRAQLSNIERRMYLELRLRHNVHMLNVGELLYISDTQHHVTTSPVAA